MHRGCRLPSAARPARAQPASHGDVAFTDRKERTHQTKKPASDEAGLAQSNRRHLSSEKPPLAVRARPRAPPLRDHFFFNTTQSNPAMYFNPTDFSFVPTTS